MKTEKLVKTIKCDQCEKEVSDNGEKYFGSSPFHDWIHLDIHNGSSYVGDMNKKREFDFCCMGCLNKFSNKTEEPKTSPISGARTENSFGSPLVGYREAFEPKPRDIIKIGVNTYLANLSKEGTDGWEKTVAGVNNV